MDTEIIDEFFIRGRFLPLRPWDDPHAKVELKIREFEIMWKDRQMFLSELVEMIEKYRYKNDTVDFCMALGEDDENSKDTSPGA